MKVTYRTGQGLELRLTAREWAARVIGRYRLARRLLAMSRWQAVGFALPALALARTIVVAE